MRNEKVFTQNVKEVTKELLKAKELLVPGIRWSEIAPYHIVEDAKELISEYYQQGTLRDKQIFSLMISDLSQLIDEIYLKRTMFFIYSNYIVKRYVKNAIQVKNNLEKNCIHEIKIKFLINSVYTTNGETIESLEKDRKEVLDNFNFICGLYINKYGLEVLTEDIRINQIEFEKALFLQEEQQEKAMKVAIELDI